MLLKPFVTISSVSIVSSESMEHLLEQTLNLPLNYETIAIPYDIKHKNTLCY